MDLGTSSTALVTGANGGIGHAIARALHPAEIEVASVEQRVGALLASVTPELASRLQAALGAGEGQARKR
jgi:NADP-dependent 3-hydroxy acid dehydrogenase YdfG